MCGLVGIYDYASSEPNLRLETLIRMRETIHHRGPDSSGAYLSENRRVGLGFRRLSIIDVSSAGNQPMSLPDGSLWIVFNGEIYNHKVLRRELEARGHTFRSNSDTEVILHLYQEEGPALLNKLRGMFALAIWDVRKKQFWLARDRMGIKPLYYTFSQGRFIFASEIKAILAHPGVARKVDPTALYHYLTFLATPPPLTLFDGISKLPAAHSITVNEVGQTRLFKYWDAFDNNEPTLIDSPGDAPAALLHLLEESVRLRMVSDVPLGVFLSGGIDSSTNLALMSKTRSEPIDTFSIGYQMETRHNELPQARRAASLFNANYHETTIGEKELLKFLPTLIHHQDEPIADPVCVPLYFVAKLAKESGVTVCQVGEGSDEEV